MLDAQVSADLSTALAASPRTGESTSPEKRMLKRRIRNLAVTAITVVSAVLLTVLGVTGASAATIAAANSGQVGVAATTAAANASMMPDTTDPTCANGLLRACVRVFGSGDTIDVMDGWAWNPDPVDWYAQDGGEFWNELYYVSQDGPPGGLDYVPIVANASGNGTSPNCPFAQGTVFPAESNSPNCTWYPTGTDNPVNTGYYCDALWETGPVSISYICVYVHP